MVSAGGSPARVEVAGGQEQVYVYRCRVCSVVVYAGNRMCWCMLCSGCGCWCWPVRGHWWQALEACKQSSLESGLVRCDSPGATTSPPAGTCVAMTL
jgi:hypothetical protein